MTWWKVLIIILIIVLVAFGLWRLRVQRDGLEGEVQTLQAELSGLLEENRKFEERIEYLEDDENLLKEARSQFNYRAPGEELIIIVPEE